ncbi:MAG: radical SAM protein [Deltaproteobacteria bacterium]|nr:radical SAM protein [Deltaproteobacteria bacterium]
MNRFMREKLSTVVKHAFQKLNHAPIPRRLHIDIAHDCNLNCFMCPRHLNKTEKKNMSLEEFSYIVRQFPIVNNIILQGTGETFTNPYLFDILATGGRRGMQFTITTNGTLLHEENVRRLSNVVNITVSIDTACAQEYKRIRGADLNVVVGNLKRLKEIRNEIQINIQTIIMEDNLDSLPQMITLAQEIDAGQLNILHLEGFDQALAAKHASLFTRSESILTRTAELARTKGIRLVYPSLVPRLRGCFEPWFSPRISLSGDIYPCCYMYVSAQPTWRECYQGLCMAVPQYQYKMGNIFKDSFAKIWNDKDFRLLRKTVRESSKRFGMSALDLNKKRVEIDTESRFSYCRVCLYKWDCAC